MKFVCDFYAPVGPVCWCRPKAALSPLWLVRVTVADLDAGLSAVRENGG